MFVFVLTPSASRISSVNSCEVLSWFVDSCSAQKLRKKRTLHKSLAVFMSLSLFLRIWSLRRVVQIIDEGYCIKVVNNYSIILLVLDSCLKSLWRKTVYRIFRCFASICKSCDLHTKATNVLFFFKFIIQFLADALNAHSSTWTIFNITICSC